MRLHDLRTQNKDKKRVGRGGKRGTTSGRGTKGQKSRSGHVIRPAERDLILKLPKRRGFRNKPKSDKYCAVNVGDISRVLQSSAKGSIRITPAVLKGAGLVDSKFYGDIKILARGEAVFPMNLAKGIIVSKGAREKIEKAGGKIEE